MKRLTAATRISLGLTSATICLLSVTHVLGLFPDPLQETAKGRGSLCETIAIQYSIAAQNGNMASLKSTADAIVKRNPDLLSVAVRRIDGEFFFQTENHEQLWENTSIEKSTSTHVQIPILRGNNPWAIVQLHFHPLVRNNLFGIPLPPFIWITAFIGIAGFFMYRLYLRRVLLHLDPSAVIPERVKAAMDTMTEGVLILDNKERIVLANEAFSKAVGITDSELCGRQASKIPWEHTRSDHSSSDYPWSQVTNDGVIQKGTNLKLKADSGMRSFVVNSAPIIAANGVQRGTITTFADITGVEKQNAQLQEMLINLEDSREKVKVKNKELAFLAAQDPLTGCLNRRAMYEQLDIEWERASRYKYALSCIIGDIDHFKRVNDNHGHRAGDSVLKEVARNIQSIARKSDIVCRYGGEEFIILLPHTNIEQAEKVAEKIRSKVGSLSIEGITVTISLGISSTELDTHTHETLIELADIALYAAKNAGRDDIVRADQMPDDVVAEKNNSVSAKPVSAQESRHISFSAVNSLVSALRYRDPDTAAHSRRVADLSAKIGAKLMSINDCYVLEIAGLLHDIGKIGVPDSILLKPGKLTEEEWAVMGTHECMGIDIINAAFGSTELTNIISNHHTLFGGDVRDPNLPTGIEIPLRARILSITDAFDAIVSDRVYRKGRSHEEAFEELRRCAGIQFDPTLVELSIDVLSGDVNHQSDNIMSTNVESALRIGLELERLAATLDVKDTSMLRAITGRLSEVATMLKLPRIAELAAELQESVTSGPNQKMTFEKTTELMELCYIFQNKTLTEFEESRVN